MNDGNDVDVLIDERIVSNEQTADESVGSHPWIAEARALPSRIGQSAPPLSEMEAAMAAEVPEFEQALQKRQQIAELDAIDKLRAKMPKPEHLVANYPVVPELQPSFQDQLTVSNLFAMVNLGLRDAVAEKIEATVAAVAQDPVASPSRALLREMLPLAKSLELKTSEGQPAFDAMARLRLAAMRGEELLKPMREIVLERARAAIVHEDSKLKQMRLDVEKYGRADHPDSRASIRFLADKGSIGFYDTRPEPSAGRTQAEQRRQARAAKSVLTAHGFVSTMPE